MCLIQFYLLFYHDNLLAKKSLSYFHFSYATVGSIILTFFSHITKKVWIFGKLEYKAQVIYLRKIEF